MPISTAISAGSRFIPVSISSSFDVLITASLCNQAYLITFFIGDGYHLLTAFDLCNTCRDGVIKDVAKCVVCGK